MVKPIYDCEYTLFGGAVREDYLIAMLGCQVVFVSAVRQGCEIYQGHGIMRKFQARKFKLWKRSWKFKPVHR